MFQLNAFPANSPILFTALMAKDNIIIIIVTERWAEYGHFKTGQFLDFVMDNLNFFFAPSDNPMPLMSIALSDEL